MSHLSSLLEPVARLRILRLAVEQQPPQCSELRAHAGARGIREGRRAADDDVEGGDVLDKRAGLEGVGGARAEGRGEPGEDVRGASEEGALR